VKRSILRTVGKYAFGFGLLAVVMWWYWAPTAKSPGLGVILSHPEQWRWEPLALAIGLCTAAMLLSFVRWYFLVRALDLPFTMTNAIRLGLIGYFWNTCFPGSVGGDVVKAYYISREQKRRVIAVASVLIDRAVGLWALIWFVALLGSGLWLAGDPVFEEKQRLQTIVYSALGLVAFTSFLWMVLSVLPERRCEKFAWRLSRIPKLGGAAAEFWRAIWMYRDRQRSILLALVLALIGHVGWVLTFYFAVQVPLPAHQMQAMPSMTEHFLIVPIAMTGEAMIPLPGGVGGGEMAYAFVYDNFVNRPGELAVAGSLFRRAINYLIAFVGYLVYLSLPKAERVEGSWTRDETAAEEEVPGEAAVA
jgi:uncharacterized protein (TIRG00374 family)